MSIADPTLTIKYVDDTTILYSSRDPEDATLQNAANKLSEWSSDNKMKLNAKKTKELVINFSKKIPPPNSITIDNTIIERVNNAKILGIILSDDLTWNAHIDHVTKKATKRLYMLTRCKRAGVTKDDMIGIYCSLIRPILEYCCVIWHSSLPQYLHDALESIQKRAVKIICGYNSSYPVCLEELNIESLWKRREDICKKIFHGHDKTRPSPS